MAVNCCNGRVGRRLMELAVQQEALQRFTLPTGIEIVKAIGDLGGDINEAMNCCNGRVGRRLDTQAVAQMLAGAEDV